MLNQKTKEIILLSPPVSTSKKFHLGSLYTLLSLDLYYNSLNKIFPVNYIESWNIKSKKNVSNISNLNFIYENYISKFNWKHVVTYKLNDNNDLVIDNICKLILQLIDENKILYDQTNKRYYVQIYKDNIIDYIQKIYWYPSYAKKIFQNMIKTLDDRLFIDADLNYGIILSKNNKKVGKYFFISLYPILLKQINFKGPIIIIGGRDILRKYVLHLINTQILFKENQIHTISLHGLLLKNGHKVSKYNWTFLDAKQYIEHKNYLYEALSFHKWGNDFELYDKYLVGAKRHYNLSHKIIHSLKNHNVTRSFLDKVKITYYDILQKVINFNFKEAYIILNKLNKLIKKQLTVSMGNYNISNIYKQIFDLLYY